MEYHLILKLYTSLVNVRDFFSFSDFGDETYQKNNFVLHVENKSVFQATYNRKQEEMKSGRNF